MTKKKRSPLRTGLVAAAICAGIALRLIGWAVKSKIIATVLIGAAAIFIAVMVWEMVEIW